MRFAAVAVIASLALGGCFHHRKSSTNGAVAGIGLAAAAVGGLVVAMPSDEEYGDGYGSNNNSGDLAFGAALLIGGLAAALIAVATADTSQEPEPSYMVSAYPPPCVVCVPLPPPPPPPPSPCPCPAPY